MNTVHIPSGVLKSLPKTSLVRRLCENDPTLAKDLTAVARSKVYGRFNEMQKRATEKRK